MESVLESLLNLPNVRVLNSEFTGQGDLVIRVESTERGTTCRRCGREIEQLHGYDRALRLRHLPLFERRVYLEIRPKRYRCGHCEGGPTTTQRCSWYEPNSPSTRAFEHDMLRALINSTVADVSRKHGLSEESVEGIVERYLAKQIDWSALEWLGVVGIDEIALRKGHRDFVVIVTSRDAEGRLRVLGGAGRSPQGDRGGVSECDPRAAQGHHRAGLYG